MSYDRVDLEQAIRTGGPLPEALLNIFKENAARRRSAKINARLHRVTQHLKGLAKTREQSLLTPLQQRLRQGQAGFPPIRPIPAT